MGPRAVVIYCTVRRVRSPMRRWRHWSEDKKKIDHLLTNGAVDL